MNTPYQAYVKYVLIAILVATGLGSIWYTRHIGSQLLEMEKNNLELWAKTIEFTSSEPYRATRNSLKTAIESLSEATLDRKRREALKDIIRRADDELGSASLNFVTSEILLKQRFEIPALITDADGRVLISRNADIQEGEINWNDRFQTSYQPIKIELPAADSTIYQYLYYRDSNLILMLKYFPFVQLGLVGLVFALAYLSWSSIRKTEQSNVWVGMAREAAHQLGTPISGLMGWVELLKMMGVDNANLREIAQSLEMDVARLHSVADRFEKIGSKPELQTYNLNSLLTQCADYLKNRIPLGKSHLELLINCDSSIEIDVNSELFTWSIENILKNALDAKMPDQTSFFIHIDVVTNESEVIISISDNGKGMEKKVQRDVFKAGFSTKKRGWGLGLSLTKRIVEDYHKGSIIVAHTQIGEGTIFEIRVPKIA